MFSLIFKKSNLNLSKDEWKYVELLISKPGVLMVFEDGEIDSSKLMALGECLKNDRTGTMRLYVYHICQNDPVELLHWNGEYPNGRYCPICNNKYMQNNTNYDIELIIKYPLLLE